MDRRTFLKIAGMSLVTSCNTSVMANTVNPPLCAPDKFKPVFDEIGKLVDFIKPGNLILIAARPSLGKTRLSVSIGKYLQNYRNKLVMYIAPYRNRYSRHGMDYVGIHLNRAAFVNFQEMQVEDYCKDRHDVLNGLALLIIDDMNTLNSYNENHATADRTLVWAKALAVKFNMAVLLTTGLKREICERDDHRPRITDLIIANDYPLQADAMIMLYRDEIYHLDSRLPGITEATVILSNHQKYGPHYLSLERSVKTHHGIYKT